MMRAGGSDGYWAREINFFDGETPTSNEQWTFDNFPPSPLPAALGHYSGTTGRIYNGDLVWDAPANGGTWQFSTFNGGYTEQSQNSGPWAPYYISGPH